MSVGKVTITKKRFRLKSTMGHEMGLTALDTCECAELSLYFGSQCEQTNLEENWDNILKSKFSLH